jgi:hypothetical protein
MNLTERRTTMPRGAAVIPYDGKRGRVWRIKYTDGDGRQVMETVGAERDGVTRKQAEGELRERLVRVERKGYRRPKRLTFAEYAATWLEKGATRRDWKPGTVRMLPLRARASQGGVRADAARVGAAARRCGVHDGGA